MRLPAIKYPIGEAVVSRAGPRTECFHAMYVTRKGHKHSLKIGVV